MGFEPTTPTFGRLCSMPDRLRFALEAKSRCGAPSIGEKLEMSPGHQSVFTTNLLKSLALPRGLEPLFSP
jgi:hypothetical protein